ncbi:Rha family transcriptional regulator [Pseudomonas sp. HN8-3]|uniref:Rha family transcriptional regulator n=1 Tax=Pseudomonas sp. HN8-3 TaxID=2886361 RepID=UPI001E5D8137|nr:Rha family transcriptional regulator [Pseudomonas sp. HN8-3]UEH06692.1 Rha family transcriptional regulator [Pseudomonas sp. HN8-3]
MNNSIINQRGDSVTMSSREIAELVESRHDSVKRTIERLAERKVIGSPPMVEYLDGLGRPATEYLFSGEKGKRDSLVVVAQLSPEFTGALVDRWQKLEAQQADVSLDTDEGKLLVIQGLATKQLALIAENKRVTQQRDYAIETKAEIGSRREATAMATASAAVRQANQLKEELGRGLRQATVAAVEKIAKRKFGKQGFRPLKNWCAENGIQAPKVHDPRYGWVRSWPAAAWAAVYHIDLAELFGAYGEQA